MPVCITGWRSRIAEEFRSLLPTGEMVIRGNATDADMPLVGRYLFCQGLLIPKSRQDMTKAEQDETWHVNYVSIADKCDWILAENPCARICIIGSESGYRGSYNESYANSKQAIHDYVESKRTGPGQQLVAISPGIIADAGMTTRRHDKGNLQRRCLEHPMKRFLRSREVAEMANTLLYEQPYITGTVIRMHGGLK